MSNKHPQTTTHTIIINNQQLSDIIAGLKSVQPSQEFDTDHLMYVSPTDMIDMLEDIQADKYDNNITHGLCL